MKLKVQYEEDFNSMIEYYPTCKQDNLNELFFPEFFSNSSEIEIIEPLYDNLKIGDEVKFVVKSNILDEIVIIGEHPYYVKKNTEELFEEIIKVGEKCGIAKKNDKGQCIFLVKYNVRK